MKNEEQLGTFHSDGSNVLFLDGHTEWLGVEDGLWAEGVANRAALNTDQERFWYGED